MSVITNYLDVNSQNRDRNKYPNQMQFEVRMDSLGERGAATAFDPVCNSAPFIWEHTAFNKLDPGFNGTLTGTLQYDAGLITASGAGTIIYGRFVDASNKIHKINGAYFRDGGFYSGAVIRMVIDTPLAGSPASSRRIIDSKWMTTLAGISIVRFEIESPLPDATLNGATMIISNPTTNVGTTQFFIPHGVPIDNFHVGWWLSIVQNGTGLESGGIITEYSGNTTMATLDRVLDAGIFSANGNDFLLRKEPPSSQGTIPVVISPLAYLNSTTQIVLDSVVASATVGSYLRIVDVSTYVGPYPLQWEYMRIEQSFVVDINVGGNVAPHTVVRGPAITFTPNPGVDRYDVMPFSYDNYQPISFLGNRISVSDITCYEIKLINLSLPATAGVFSGDAPFVWVELLGTDSEVKNAIWTNADVSSSLFKVPLIDVAAPLSSLFVKLDGAGMTQFIPFKPSDTFLFTVRLPDGYIIPWMEEDYSPRPPRSMDQVSATFAIRRRV